MEPSFTAPTVPYGAADIFPKDTESFAAGIWSIWKDVSGYLAPNFSAALSVCVSVLAVVLLISAVNCLEEHPASGLIGTAAVAVLLLQPAGTLIELGEATIMELHEYCKLLIPVMTTALAAQGAAGTSAALYAGTAMLNSVLSGLLSGVLTSAVCAYLAVSAAAAATGLYPLRKTADFIRQISQWFLKATLYVFTGFMGLTGVISGSVDAAALKVTKFAVSGVVPVVGGILSDATESVLAGIGIMKNAAGIYGMLAVVAIAIRPFLRIGIQYLLLKITAGLAGIFTEGGAAKMIEAFSSAFGWILGMTGTVCLLFLISIVCFLKGVG